MAGLGPAAATALLAAGIGLHLGFVNGPPEWEWAYREAALAAAPALLAVLVAAVAVWSAALLRTGPRAPLLGVLAVVFSLAVVAAQPGGFVRVVQSISSRHSFSYVYDAAVAPPARQS